MSLMAVKNQHWEMTVRTGEWRMSCLLVFCFCVAFKNKGFSLILFTRNWNFKIIWGCTECMDESQLSDPTVMFSNSNNVIAKKGGKLTTLPLCGSVFGTSESGLGGLLRDLLIGKDIVFQKRFILNWAKRSTKGNHSICLSKDWRYNCWQWPLALYTCHLVLRAGFYRPRNASFFHSMACS